ncbi:MAG: hypothetical protein E7673_03735 [Ruminococcaceae bacterium]|nr:hypothetical protein [Oscillospiraceae bacterium]
MINQKGKTTENGLVSGALMLTASVFIVKLIGYIYKLPLSHILGDEGMGYFNSAYSIFTFFYMLSQGGVPRAVAISVSEARAKYGMSEANKILSVSLRIFLTVGILFSALLMLFSKFFARIIGNSLAALSIFCIAPSLSFISLAGVLRGYLNGIGRVGGVAVSEILDGVSKFATGLTFAMICARKNMSAPLISGFTILGVSIGAFVGAVFMLICSKNNKTNENIGQNCKSKNNKIYYARKILKISIPVTLSSAIMGATGIIDLAIIVKRLKSIGFSEAQSVALYGNFTTLVIPLLNLISAFLTPISTAAMPHITKSKTLSRTDEYYNLIGQILSLTAVVVFPVFFAYSFFGEDILILLFRDDSAKIAAPLLVAAAPSVVFYGLLLMTNTALEASGLVRAPLISMGLGAIVKIVCAYLLIGKVGIYGAPISTSLCYLSALVISFAVFRKRIGSKISLLRTTALPALLSFLIISLGRCAYIFLGFEGKNSIVFIALCLAVALIYLAFTWIFMHEKVNFLTNYVKIAKK